MILVIRLFIFCRKLYSCKCFKASCECTVILLSVNQAKVVHIHSDRNKKLWNFWYVFLYLSHNQSFYMLIDPLYMMVIVLHSVYISVYNCKKDAKVSRSALCVFEYLISYFGITRPLFHRN